MIALVEMTPEEQAAHARFMGAVGRCYWPDLLRPDRTCTKEPRCEPATPCLHPLEDHE